MVPKHVALHSLADDDGAMPPASPDQLGRPVEHLDGLADLVLVHRRKVVDDAAEQLLRDQHEIIQPRVVNPRHALAERREDGQKARRRCGQRARQIGVEEIVEDGGEAEADGLELRRQRAPLLPWRHRLRTVLLLHALVTR